MFMSLAEAIAAVIALFTNYTPPPPQPPVQAIVAPAPAEDPVILTNEARGTSTQLSGWVTYADGARKCVTAAPCEKDPAFTGPESSTYNWVTGEAYQG